MSEPVGVRVEAVRTEGFPPSDRARLIDLWCAVNDAGGAVGFVPGAAREAVEAALAVHESSMREGYTVAAVLRDEAGTIIGLTFIERVRNSLLAHGRWVYRVMVDPTCQGQGLGHRLMDGVHEIARGDGAELVSLGVRGGYGTERFYESAGYAEVGRIVGAIRVAPGDDRDDVTMSRRLD